MSKIQEAILLCERLMLHQRKDMKEQFYSMNSATTHAPIAIVARETKMCSPPSGDIEWKAADDLVGAEV